MANAEQIIKQAKQWLGKKESDKVKLKAGATYYDGTKIPSWVFEKELYVRKIKDDKVIVSIYKTGAITGVVKATNVEKI